MGGKEGLAWVRGHCQSRSTITITVLYGVSHFQYMLHQCVYSQPIRTWIRTKLHCWKSFTFHAWRFRPATRKIKYLLWLPFPDFTFLLLKSESLCQFQYILAHIISGLVGWLSGPIKTVCLDPMQRWLSVFMIFMIKIKKYICGLQLPRESHRSTRLLQLTGR